MAYIYKKPTENENKQGQSQLQTPTQYVGGVAQDQNQSQTQKAPTQDVAGQAGRQIMQANQGRGAEAVKTSLLKPLEQQTQGIQKNVAEQTEGYKKDTANLVGKIGYGGQQDIDQAAANSESESYKNISKILGGVTPQAANSYYQGSRNLTEPEAIKKGTIAENLQRTKKYGAGLANIDSALFGSGKNYADVISGAEKAKQQAMGSIAGFESGQLQKERTGALKEKTGAVQEDIKGKLKGTIGGIKEALGGKAKVADTQAEQELSQADQNLVSDAQKRFDAYLDQYYKSLGQGDDQYNILRIPKAPIDERGQKYLNDYLPLLKENMLKDPRIKQYREGLGSKLSKGKVNTSQWQDVAETGDVAKLQNLATLLGEPLDYQVGSGAKGFQKGTIQDFEPELGAILEKIKQGEIDKAPTLKQAQLKSEIEKRVDESMTDPLNPYKGIIVTPEEWQQAQQLPEYQQSIQQNTMTPEQAAQVMSQSGPYSGYTMTPEEAEEYYRTGKIPKIPPPDTSSGIDEGWTLANKPQQYAKTTWKDRMAQIMKGIK